MQNTINNRYLFLHFTQSQEDDYVYDYSVYTSTNTLNFTDVTVQWAETVQGRAQRKRNASQTQEKLEKAEKYNEIGEKQVSWIFSGYHSFKGTDL